MCCAWVKGRVLQPAEGAVKFDLFWGKPTRASDPHEGDPTKQDPGTTAWRGLCPQGIWRCLRKVIYVNVATDWAFLWELLAAFPLHALLVCHQGAGIVSTLVTRESLASSRGYRESFPQQTALEQYPTQFLGPCAGNPHESRLWQEPHAG